MTPEFAPPKAAETSNAAKSEGHLYIVSEPANTVSYDRHHHHKIVPSSRGY